MRNNKQTWYLLALLLGACAIPDIAIVESLDEGTGGTSSGKGGAANQAGTKSQGATSATGAGGDPGSAGEPSEGGSNNPGTGGRPPTAGTGTTGGTGGSPPKTAFAKFCNAVVVGGEVIDLDLRIGSGSNLVHIVAESGTCSPAVGRACQAVTTGPAVPVEVYDLDDNPIWTANLTISPGQAWIFGFYFDETTEAPGLSVKSDITPSECSSTDFDELFPAAPTR